MLRCLTLGVASATMALPTFGVRSYSASAGRGQANETPIRVQPLEALDELTKAYFQSADDREQVELARQIDRAADGSVEKVAKAIRRLALWSGLPGEGVLTFASASGQRRTVAYQLPADYDPQTAWPMIVCFSGPATSPRLAFREASELLSGRTDGYVLVAPDNSLGFSFRQPPETPTDFGTLLREVRRRIHLDSDRVYLFGAEAAGDAAWMTALSHPGLVAGVIILSGSPTLPYPEQFLRLILRNLRHVPVLSVWRADDPARADRLTPTRCERVAAHNRAIVELGELGSLPIIGLEAPVVERNANAGASEEPGRPPKPPEQAVLDVLSHRRPRLASPVEQWFRYPGQGDLGWLRQTQFKGDVWQATQLSILTTPGTDRNKFITQVLVRKMAFIGGRIEGQRITLETRRCARVELRLPEASVDFARPVTVICNSRKRYDRLIQPSIAAMLETAYQDWDFQRLTLARLSFSIQTDAADE